MLDWQELELNMRISMKKQKPMKGVREFPLHIYLQLCEKSVQNLEVRQYKFKNAKIFHDEKMCHLDAISGQILFWLGTYDPLNVHVSESLHASMHCRTFNRGASSVFS